MSKRTYQYIVRIETNYPSKEEMDELIDIRLTTFELCVKAPNKFFAKFVAYKLMTDFVHNCKSVDSSARIVSMRMIFKNGNSRRLRV